MESDPTNSTPSKASGIPRPSRLPRSLHGGSDHSILKSPIKVSHNTIHDAASRIPPRAQTSAGIHRPIKGGSPGTHRVGCQTLGGRHILRPPAPPTSEELGPNDRLPHRGEEQQDRGDMLEPKSPGTSNCRHSRLSLSDRTSETLSRVPPSPSPRPPKPTLFYTESPRHNLTRPVSSFGQYPPFPSDGQHPPPLPTQRPTSPSKRQITASLERQPAQLTINSRALGSSTARDVPQARTKASNNTSRTPTRSDLPKSAKTVNGTPIKSHFSKSLGESKKIASRGTKPRSPLKDVFTEPSLQVLSEPKSKATSPTRKPLPPHFTSSVLKSPKSPRPSRTPHQASAGLNGNAELPSTADEHKSAKSSNALRDRIAKAKAARRAAIKHDADSPAPTNTASDLSSETPTILEQPIGDALYGNNRGLLRKRIETARLDGRLNIAALGLTDFPIEVIKMYDNDVIDTNNGAWYESVDLVRLNAADNDFEEIGDQIFPDCSAGSYGFSDEASQGNQFGGLETLDLHGNRLKSVPVGFRSLNHLTILNLSRNRLGSAVIDTISQIKSLRELRLAENAIDGALSACLGDLENLTTLDLRDNKISDLPGALSKLLNLHILIVRGNHLTSLPFHSIGLLPLAELDASRNKLSGSLLPLGSQSLPKLKALDVSNNALTNIAEDNTMNVPLLECLNVSHNRITHLPNLSNSKSLMSITAECNALKSLPEGLTLLENLKVIDFTSNSLTKLDDRLGLMENLTILRIGNNPLRDRKFLSLTSENLKLELCNRLAPSDTPDPISNDMAPIKSNGILDQSSSNLHTLDASSLSPPLITTPIRTLLLHHNHLSHIPTSLVFTASTLTTLDLSSNALATTTYFPHPLSLPHLTHLSLSSNTITSLTPLIQNLSSPNLSTISLAHNRLTHLPPLRPHLPALRTVLAPDNLIAELDVSAVQGLHTLDVSSNEIGHLEPRLGLLGGELKCLVVGGNRFRVPGFRVLEKGTEATLEWLRGRIPLGEGEEMD
ncbi:hypothetical protein MMC12_003775 [Toensbergia leucococca]|nr:hypothetical protein [Toensbergia leucococca]